MATRPPAAQVDKARARIEECRSQLREREPEPEPAPEPAPQAEPDLDPVEAPEAPPPTSPERDRRWIRDPIGGALLGVGLAASVAGGALVGVGAARRQGADMLGTEGDFRSDLRSSNLMQGVGIGLAVTGGSLIVGAVIRYAMVGRARPNPSAALSFRF